MMYGENKMSSPLASSRSFPSNRKLKGTGTAIPVPLHLIRIFT